MNGPRFLPLLVPSLLLGGCIEYFAEPPDLGPLPPPLDGGADDGPLIEDVGADDGPLSEDAAPDACVMAAEVCDGEDNDCDGEVDEEGPSLCPAPELNAETAQRLCVEGACALRCIAGNHDLDGEYETGCEYACPPSNGGVEQCDARDNDCDGITDEELAPPPANRQAGVCAGATRVCVGQWVEPAYGERPGYEEPEVTCDGRDNDCDGQVDEGFDAVCCDPDDLGPPCNGCVGVAVPAAGWVCIPPGEFTMGSPEGEEGRSADEGPQRRVTLSRPLLMQTTEVTQAAWQAVAGNNPSQHREGSPDGACDAEAPGECPVEYVNWFEAAWYANALSEAEGLLPCYTLAGCNANPAGQGRVCEDPPLVDVHCEGYRLPTEAEWEYATRAGTVTRFWSGDADADLARVGWYAGNSGDRPHRVAQKPANPWGLYDVHGNVYEWVSDWYGPYDPAELRDPAGPPDGVDRIVRGGAAWSGAHGARSAPRGNGSPGRRFDDVGFRLARRPPSTGD